MYATCPISTFENGDAGEMDMLIGKAEQVNDFFKLVKLVKS